MFTHIKKQMSAGLVLDAPFKLTINDLSRSDWFPNRIVNDCDAK